MTPTASVELSELARRAWRELSYVRRADERQLARVLGCGVGEISVALEELQRAGIADRRMHRPSKGRRPARLWSLNQLKRG